MPITQLPAQDFTQLKDDKYKKLQNSIISAFLYSCEQQDKIEDSYDVSIFNYEGEYTNQISIGYHLSPEQTLGVFKIVGDLKKLETTANIADLVVSVTATLEWFIMKSRFVTKMYMSKLISIFMECNTKEALDILNADKNKHYFVLEKYEPKSKPSKTVIEPFDLQSIPQESILSTKGGIEPIYDWRAVDSAIIEEMAKVPATPEELISIYGIPESSNLMTPEDIIKSVRHIYEDGEEIKPFEDFIIATPNFMDVFYASLKEHDDKCDPLAYTRKIKLNQEYGKFEEPVVTMDAKNHMADMEPVPENTNSDEIRVDGTFGGSKFDGNKAQYSLLPPDALKAVAEVMTAGAKKYSRNNWCGLELSRVMDAMGRHINAFQSGEELASDSLQHHLAHTIANAMMAYHIAVNFPQQDDRLFKYLTPKTIAYDMYKEDSNFGDSKPTSETFGDACADRKCILHTIEAKDLI